MLFDVILLCKMLNLLQKISNVDTLIGVLF